MMENYSNSFISALILGLYYLKISNFKEAKRCFQESINQDKRYGIPFLFHGYALSCLKEGVQAIASFKTAKTLMIGSYKPLFYLAREFNLINDELNSHFYYRKALEKKATLTLYLHYACFLYKCDILATLGDVMKIIRKHELDKNSKTVFYYLTYFLCLGTGKFLEAEVVLKDLDKDWKYFACLGYAKHLLNQKEEAAECYAESLLLAEEKVTILDELIKYVLENASNYSDYDLVDYASDLFEAINLSQSLHVKL